MGSPSGQLVGVLIDPLDQDLDAFADALLGALDVELLDERGETGEALGDDMALKLALIGLGLGAVLVGVAEHADHIQAGGGQEPLELKRDPPRSLRGNRR